MKKEKTRVDRPFATSISNEKRTVLNQFDRVEKSWKVNEYSTSVNDEGQSFFSHTEPILIQLCRSKVICSTSVGPDLQISGVAKWRQIVTTNDPYKSP